MPADLLEGIEARRAQARELAAHEHIVEPWRSAYAEYAAACEKLIRLRERSTFRDVEGLGDAR